MAECSKVQILLSSYNGEKYVREQLDSFLKLEDYQYMQVLIRDDGSTDNTPDILREYEEKYGFEVIYGKNIGIIASYNLLFKSANLSCDYFALCDQDDVWLPHKITKGLQLLKQFRDNGRPLLYGSRVEIVDSNLKHLGYSPDYKKGASFYNALAQNILPGHTMIMNRNLLQLITVIPDRVEIYADWWIYLTASGMGSAIYDNTIGVLHRQHRSNTVGHEQRFLKSMMKRVRRLKKGSGNQNSIQMQEFYERYSDYLPIAYKQEIEKHLCSFDNIYTRIKHVMTCKAYRQSILENIIFKVLYIFGKYNLYHRDGVL